MREVQRGSIAPEPKGETITTAPVVSISPTLKEVEGDDVQSFSSPSAQSCTVDTLESNRSSKGVGLVLEVFSGSSRLTKACMQLGLRGIAVDKDRKRSEGTTVLELDLTLEEDCKRLQDLREAEGDACLHAHFAPACGTCSRARERKLEGIPLDQQPRPLRSETHPAGLPSLTPSEQQRVSSANLSYDSTAWLIDWLLIRGCSCSLENPKNSLFWPWLYGPIKALLAKWEGHTTIFQHCMHGGDRDKTTAWWSHDPKDPQVNMFASLALMCNGLHQHASWKPYRAGNRLVFPTHQEAAYPMVLCQRIADILFEKALALRLTPESELADQIQGDDSVATRQLFAQQPKGRKLKPLVSEYQRYIAAFTMVNDETSIQQFLSTLPKGAKVCHQKPVPGGVSRDDMIKKYSVTWFSKSFEEARACELKFIGVPREPLDFVKEAVEKGHPRDLLARVTPLAQELVDEMVHKTAALRTLRRTSFLKHWLRRSLELKQEEKQLHQSLPDHAGPILGKKRLVLFKEMLKSLSYPDHAIADDIVKGFALTGWAPKTGVFARDVRRPEFDLPHLKRMLPGLNSAVLKSLENQTATEDDDYAWEETMEEVKRGWLRESSSFNLGECAVAKRFPLRQAEKIRLIDDFSICGVNSTFGMPEKLRVHCVDIMTAYVATLMDRPDLPADFKVVGRTFDLKSAYKQFPVDDFHASFLKIAVKKPGGTYGVFDVLALPFGATGSVSAFLRVSSALHFIGLHMGVLWTSFFDDFTAICPADDQESVTYAVHCLFKLLGIDFAEEGKKAPDFSQLFQTLGLQISRSVTLRNEFAN